MNFLSIPLRSNNKYFLIVFCILLNSSTIAQSNLPEKINLKLNQYENEQISIDGFLDEGVWSKATVVSGFYNYLPVDGGAAEDDAKIYIWYSAEAIYLGVSAEAKKDKVRSTLADRDKLNNDDYFLFILDTYNDQRTAYAFAVNPIGQQYDGTITDNVPDRKASMPYTIDKNPDYVYSSKGRITDDGFEIEIKKSPSKAYVLMIATLKHGVLMF